MNMAAVILVVAVWAAAGFTLYSLVSGTRSQSRAEALGWSLLLGSGMMGYLLFLISALGQKPTRLLVLGIPVLLTTGIGGICFYSRRWPQFPGAVSPSRKIFRIWLALGLVVLLMVEAVAIIAVLTRMDSWDAFAIWGLKGKVLAEASLASNPFFDDPAFAYAHLSYPVGLPLQYAAVYSVLGEVDEFAVKLLCMFQFLAYAAFVYAAAAVHFDRIRAMVLTIVAVTVPLPMLVATMGYGDFPLALGCLAMLYGLSRWLQSRSRPDLLLAAMAAGLNVNIKNEGIALMLIVVIALFVLRFNRQHLAGVLVFAGVALLFMLPVLVWKTTVPTLDEDYLAHLKLNVLAENLHRLPLILGAWLWNLADIRRWGIIWYALPIMAVYGRRSFSQPWTRMVWLVLAGQFAVYTLIYVISPHALAWHLATSMDRLLVHLTPAVLLLLGFHWAAPADERPVMTMEEKRVPTGDMPAS